MQRARPHQQVDTFGHARATLRAGSMRAELISLELGYWSLDAGLQSLHWWLQHVDPLLSRLMRQRFCSSTWS